MINYHTQENRGNKLEGPIYCKKDNAWLGDAYYFWEGEDDAIFWGEKAKNRKNSYQIYSADINMDNILDTVFSREEYFFWLRSIEKAAKTIIKKTNSKPTIKEINDYFNDRGIWKKFDGILFQDISNNPIHFIVKEFQYKKRIQLAVYNNDIIINFKLHYTS